MNAISNILERLVKLENEVKELKGSVRASGSERERKEKGIGIPVWESYCEAYKKVYKIEPIRNMRANRACADLARRVGKENAVELVKFYLDQRDSFLIKNTHDIKFCLNQAESLMTKMKTGLNLSSKQAKTVELRERNARVTREYLRKKREKRGEKN